jgi:hypothetical protein
VKWRSASALAGSVLVLSLALAASAGAADRHEYAASFGPDGTAATAFASASSVAVDQADHLVYVLDAGAGKLLKFDTTGQPVDFGGSAANVNGNAIEGLQLVPSGGSVQVAVDAVSHRIFITGEEGKSVQAFEASGEPALFTAGPGSGTNTIGGFERIWGVAVDGAGNIYASDRDSSKISVFTAAGEPLTQLGITTPSNIAVDSAGTVYAISLREEGFEALSQVFTLTPSEVPVTPATTYTENPQPITPRSQASISVGIDPATNDLYVAQRDAASFAVASIAQYGVDGTLLATFGGPGEAGALSFPGGVAIDSGSGAVFASTNPDGGLSQVAIFTPFVPFEGPPTVVSTSASGVSSTAATLRARIHPNGFATTYRFEYGLADCATGTCASVAGPSIGGGFEPVSVAAEISGLIPNTTYHLRVVAKNEKGVTAGPDRPFTTQIVGTAFQLGDSRVWEMVSPAQKLGGIIATRQTGIVQASDSGDALAYLSRGSLEAEPEGNRQLELSTAVAHREAGAWSSRDLTPPHTEATILRLASEYKLFSSDLARAMLEPTDSTPLSEASSERTPYLWTKGAAAPFTPMVTSKPGFANVSPAAPFAVAPTEGEVTVAVSVATPDLSHIALTSRVPLLPGTQPFALYEWFSAEGSIEPVSVLPADEGGGVVAAQPGSGVGSVRNSISADGSRIFWSPPSENSETSPALYLRDTAANWTGRLDLAELGASGAGVPRPAFQGASSDGSVVYFTDSQALTADASPTGRDLYRCEIGLVGGGLGCLDIEDISAPPVGSGESAEVQGMASALSQDGTRVYFVALGALGAGANGEGETARPGEPNLYLWQEGSGLRFLASLADGDSFVWGKAPTAAPNESRLSTAVSPSGRYLTFMSERSLTGYENRNPISDQPNQEAFFYDAAGQGELTCISCNPSGADAVGELHPEQNLTSGSVDIAGLWIDRWVAATLPQASIGANSVGVSLYRPRSVSNSGRAFFNAFDSLVPGDSNGTWDVYEFQPLGVGSCTAASHGPALTRSGPGCVGLISSGTAAEESAFLDASASGDDAFFVTSERLSVLDVDDIHDVYDARVGGIKAVTQPVSECSGEACQAMPSQPNDATPASVTFQGPGNLKKGKRCAKGKRRVGARCVPRKKHRSKAKKRASKNRRAAR